MAGLIDVEQELFEFPQKVCVTPCSSAFSKITEHVSCLGTRNI